MKLHPSELALIGDLASTRDSWEAAAAEALAEPREAIWSSVPEKWECLSRALQTADERQAFRAVVHELLSGQAHSFLVSLDGGSALAETTLVTIQDAQGHVFRRYLHESWPEVGGMIDG